MEYYLKMCKKFNQYGGNLILEKIDNFQINNNKVYHDPKFIDENNIVGVHQSSGEIILSYFNISTKDIKNVTLIDTPNIYIAPGKNIILIFISKNLLKLVNANTMNTICEIIVDTSGIYRYSISPNFDRIAIYNSGHLNVFNVSITENTSIFIRKIDLFVSYPELSFTPDSRNIVVHNKNMLFFYSAVEEDTPLKLIKFPDEIKSFVIFPDNVRILIYYKNNSIEVRDITTGRLINILLKEQLLERIYNITSRVFFISNNNKILIHYNNKIYIFDANSYNLLKTFDLPNFDFNISIHEENNELKILVPNGSPEILLYKLHCKCEL